MICDVAEKARMILDYGSDKGGTVKMIVLMEAFDDDLVKHGKEAGIDITSFKDFEVSILSVFIHQEVVQDKCDHNQKALDKRWKLWIGYFSHWNSVLLALPAWLQNCMRPLPTTRNELPLIPAVWTYNEPLPKRHVYWNKCNLWTPLFLSGLRKSQSSENTGEEKKVISLE